MRRRGSAMLVVLLTALVLFVMLKMLVVLATSQTSRSLAYNDRVSSLYIVDAAVAHAMNELSKRADWDRGFHDEPLSRGEGSYTIVFHTGPGPVLEHESVNNMLGTAPAPGFRGSASVPAGSAELVILARARRTTRKVRVVVSGQPVSSAPAVVVAAGNLLLRGNVVVNGVTTLDAGSQPIKANLQSNRSDAAADIVRWRQASPGDRAVVDGSVRCASADPAAINFGTDTAAYQVDSLQTGTSAAPLTRVDVAGEVAAHASDPTPGINTLGQSTLNAGDFYHNGDLVINGDLSLDDTNLYVSGNLTVNGSITGSGSLYVGGETAFEGDAAVASGDAQGVGLFSEGSVRLTGMNGTAYMDAAVAADPQAAVWWDDLKVTLADLQTRARADIAANGDLRDIEAYVDEMREVLGTDSNHNHAPYQGRTRDATGKLQSFLRQQPASTARDFMLERLDEMQRIFADPTQNPYSTFSMATFLAWLSGEEVTTYGLLDASITYSSNQQIERLLNRVLQIDHTRIGSSYFQGRVYTNGYFYASNEVTIIGSLTAAGNRSGNPTTLGTEQVLPGDIVLDNNCRLTLTQDGAGPVGTPSGTANVSLRAWIEP